MLKVELPVARILKFPRWAWRLNGFNVHFMGARDMFQSIKVDSRFITTLTYRYLSIYCIYLSIYLPTYLPIYLSIDLSIYLPKYTLPKYTYLQL